MSSKTNKHKVTLWEWATVLRRREIVVETPSGWDSKQVETLNGCALDYLADNCGSGAEWELERTEHWEVQDEIEVAGLAPSDAESDIVFMEDERGGLIEAETGEPAFFNEPVIGCLGE